MNSVRCGPVETQTAHLVIGCTQQSVEISFNPQTQCREPIREVGWDSLDAFGEDSFSEFRLLTPLEISLEKTLTLCVPAK